MKGTSVLRPVVYFATNHDWFSYQHFYQGLAQAFATTRPVLYVGGVSRTTDELREVADNVWLLNVRVPKGAARRMLRPWRDRLIARAAKKAMEELGWTAAPLVWTYTTDATPFLKATRDATSVYWTGDEVIDPLEGQLLKVIDRVFTVSPAATAQKTLLAGASRVTEMPIATDPGPYEAAANAQEIPAELTAHPRPWFGYGGAVNGRTDWSLVESLAEKTEGTVFIIGPANDGEGRRQMARTDSPSNLVFLGHRDAEQAMHYIAALDVGLIPYMRSAFNVGSNPVKTYDYLSAGIRVVATDLPAIRSLAPLVLIANDHAEFVELALAEAARPMTQRERSERHALAREYSYDALVARIDDVLGDAARVP